MDQQVGAQKLNHNPLLFPSQWAFLKRRSTPRPLRRNILTSFCVHKCFPAQGWKPGNVTGLGRLNISQKAHASALSSRKISTTYTIVF